MSLSARLRRSFGRVGLSLGRMRVGHQLLGAFGAILVLTSLLGAAALYELRLVNHEADDLANKWLAGVGELAGTRAREIETREYELKHSRTNDRSHHAEYEDKTAAAAAAVADLVTA